MDIIQSEKLKKLEVEMLITFADICDKLGLKYYLIGGTLIGAIRHKGFIPWDDDIDVGMFREDYEKFLETAPSLLPENLFLQHIYSEPEYLMPFAKIRNSNTTFIESSVNKYNINHGIYIDIFPIDYYPEDLKLRNYINSKKANYDRRIICQFNHQRKQSYKYKIKSLMYMLKYPSIRTVVKKRDNLYKSVPKSNKVANFGGAWGEKEIVPVDWYGDGVFVEFEGHKFNAPSEYHKFLTQVYGDYMTLPPVEQRVTHHFTDVVDLDKTYKEYL